MRGSHCPTVYAGWRRYDLKPTRLSPWERWRPRRQRYTEAGGTPALPGKIRLVCPDVPQGRRL